MWANSGHRVAGRRLGVRPPAQRPEFGEATCSGRGVCVSDQRHRSVRTADGVELHVVEAGRPDGPAIVFVHGLASSSAAWAGLLDHQELARRFRLIAFDLRGHGQSATDLKPEQLTADGPEAGARPWAQDRHGVGSGAESPILVGWSFGGSVVQSWLQTHRGPGSAPAVALICAPDVFGPVPAGDAAG